MAVILTTCFPSNPRTLWDQLHDLLSEDYLFQHRHNVGNPDADYNEEVYNLALCSPEDKLIMMGGCHLSSTYLHQRVAQKIGSRESTSGKWTTTKSSWLSRLMTSNST